MADILCYIPTYNDSEQVQSSLASSPDWNVVISDNASSEPHRTALAALAGPRVQVIRHEQQLGRVGNWRFCVEHFIGSGAAWMKFLLAGDLHTPGALDIYRRAIAAYPAERLIVGRIENIAPPLREIWQPTQVTAVATAPACMENILRHGNVFHGLLAPLFHVETVRDGFSFGEGTLSYCADLLFLMNIARRTGCLYVAEIVGQFVTQHRKHFSRGHGSLEHFLEESLMRLRAAQAYCELTGKHEKMDLLEGALQDWLMRALRFAADQRQGPPPGAPVDR